MTDKTTTVLVPAYRSDRIAETVATLAAQDSRDFIVRIGYDFAPGYSPPDLADAGIPLDVIRHQDRLGWVGNVNALLATVETRYFLILAHDDGLTANYLSAAVGALEANPDAVVAHGTVEHFGIRGGEIARTDSITGTPFKRVAEFIRRGPHISELGWRGVVRRDAIPYGMRLRRSMSDGQFSNTLFALELLLFGDSIFLPGISYQKHTAPNGLSRDFVGRGADAKSAMLADNLSCLARLLGEQDGRLSLEEREALLSDYAHWLLKLQGAWNVLAEEKDSSRRRFRDLREPVARFVARALLSAIHEPGDSG